MNAENTDHTQAPRRTFLLGLLSIGLAACGFQPRGTVELPPTLQRLYIGGPQAERDFVAALTRLLKQNGGQVVGSPSEATLRLSVLSRQPGRREVVIDPRARLRELELTLRVTVKAEDAQGIPLLPSESFDTARTMHYDPNNLLGQGEEEARLREEMLEIVAQSILARLRQKALQVQS
ncbi:MAG: LPS assembly lipoprotein LptE [Pseudomonadota bacterium]